MPSGIGELWEMDNFDLDIEEIELEEEEIIEDEELASGSNNGGFFSNLLQGNFGQNAQSGINNWLGGINPPTINTESSINQQSIMTIGIVAIVVLIVMKKLK